MPDMSMLTRLTNRLWPRRLRRDLEDEVEFHIDMKAGEYLKTGMSEDEATKEAHQDFGDIEAVVADMRKERLTSLPMIFAMTAVVVAVVVLWLAQQQLGTGDLETPSVRAVSIFRDPNLPRWSSPPPSPPPPPPRDGPGPQWFRFNRHTNTFEAIHKGPGAYSPGRLLDDKGGLIDDTPNTR
jgi:hypothetical protein